MVPGMQMDGGAYEATLDCRMHGRCLISMLVGMHPSTRACTLLGPYFLCMHASLVDSYVHVPYAVPWPQPVLVSTPRYLFSPPISMGGYSLIMRKMLGLVDG